MNEMKKNGLFFIIILFCIAHNIASCDHKYENSRNTEKVCLSNSDINDCLCRCFLFNTGCYDKNFLIEVMNNGLLTVSTGTENARLYDKISNNENIALKREAFLEEVVSMRKKRLSATEFNKLRRNMSLNAENIKYHNPFSDSIYCNQWMALIFIKDRHYIFKIDEDNKTGNTIVDQLVLLSDIDINASLKSTSSNSDSSSIRIIYR